MAVNGTETGGLAAEKMIIEVERPVDLVIWLSRLYLLHGESSSTRSMRLHNDLDEMRLKRISAALVRVLDIVAATTQVPFRIHGMGCPHVAFYEQALITGIRNLQSGSRAGFRVAMSAIVPLTALRVIQDDMQEIATELRGIEHSWDGVSGNNKVEAESQRVVELTLH
ncbi:MAG: hypothetical protein AAF417_16840 [Pseudomonadota bacterium]